MIPTPAIRNLIREDKVHQIYSAMQTGQEKYGMQTMNQSLATLHAAEAGHAGDGDERVVEQGRAAGNDQPRRRRGCRRGARSRPGATAAAGGIAIAEVVRERLNRDGAVMATFAYSGRTRAGQNVTGERVAESMDAAVAALRRDQILVTTDQPGEGEGRQRRRSRRAPKAVNPKRLAIFTRQFSVMIDAGLPLVQCLEILGTQEEDKHFSQTILATRGDVESGASLADAMRKHPKTFDPLFTNMIAAGEAGGILDTILKRLATYIEKNVKLKSQVKSAMIYPVAIIVIAAVVVTVILWKVIPTFANLFAGLGAELPLPTRIVIAMSNGVVVFMPYMVVTMIAAVFGFRSYYATPGGRMVIDGITLEAADPRACCCARLPWRDSAGRCRRCWRLACRFSRRSISRRAPPAMRWSRPRSCTTRKSIERGETIAAPLQRDGGVSADGGADDWRR